MAETKCGFDGTPEVHGSVLLETYGPTILVNIGFDSNWDIITATALPIPSIIEVNALVDTGATECCIDDLLAVQLNLPIIDRIPVSGSAGQHEANMYLCQIYIPSLNFTMYGAFAGLHLTAGGQPHKALIGRTFLRSFTMIYEGQTGTVILRS